MKLAGRRTAVHVSSKSPAHIRVHDKCAFGAEQMTDRSAMSNDSNGRPPADAPLGRVQGLHHEVVCYVVAADTGVVLVASDALDA